MNDIRSSLLIRKVKIRSIKMLKKKIQVGSEILHTCSRCNLELWHTVLAMIGSDPARVRCNTCKSERNYRKAKPKSTGSSGSKTTARQRKTTSDPDFYRQKLQENIMKSPIDYRIDKSFEENDVVLHKKFGKGVVLKTIPPDRAEIIFQDQTRVLVCKLT